jgi:hypothetical protein
VNWQLASNVTFTWKQPHEVDCAEADIGPTNREAKMSKQTLAILLNTEVKVNFFMLRMI